jgi:lauroyl/myristoyl acyltransferase
MSNLWRDLRRAQRRMLFLTLRSLMRRFGFDSARRVGARRVLPPGGSVEDDTMEILRHQEARILAHPELWSWHQRHWREFPLAPDLRLRQR